MKPPYAFIPRFGSTHDITTTNEKVTQLWQELTMLSHNSNREIKARLEIAPYIKQAKLYYKDAIQSDWKSGCLLYYYSFLNLAKAYLLAEESITFEYLKSTSVYHGLRAEPQEIERFIDYELEIHPSYSNGKKNIFALLYENITKQNWPFTKKIKIKLSDIIGYCRQISHEIELFYGYSHSILVLQSIINKNNKEIWLEIIVTNAQYDTLNEYLSDSIDEVIPNILQNRSNYKPWQKEYIRNTFSFKECSLIRLFKTKYNEDNFREVEESVRIKAGRTFQNYFCDMPTNMMDSINNHFWFFIPKAILNTQEVFWHPLLSNYLISFALSSILRYQPHMLYKDNQDSFIAEAWSNQCPIEVLRHFLLNFTEPRVRLN